MKYTDENKNKYAYKQLRYNLIIFGLNPRK